MQVRFAGLHQTSNVMADRKPFLLRIDADVLDAVQRWANDDLRSLNGQIEFLLRKVLKEEGRLRDARAAAADAPDAGRGSTKEKDSVSRAKTKRRAPDEE